MIYDLNADSSYYVPELFNNLSDGSYKKNPKYYEETIVSNFDYVFIVTSLNQDYSENRIARYVSITLNTGAKPVVILSKADLCDDVELKVEITKAVCDKADVIAISSLTGYGHSGPARNRRIGYGRRN